jgi:hypothetical protein
MAGGEKPPPGNTKPLTPDPNLIGISLELKKEG